MLNKAILMGRLTRDPELRYTQSNIPVVTFSIAVDRNYSNNGGERQTDFIDIVAWRRTAEFVSQWFTKGQMIVVVGSIQSRRWQDKNGNNRTSIEVVADGYSLASPSVPVRAAEAIRTTMVATRRTADIRIRIRMLLRSSPLLHQALICRQAIRILLKFPMMTAKFRFDYRTRRL